jgi:hypothetical protein
MLAELQTRLERHFQSLQAERSGLAYPVYALEHGLDAPEVVALRETLSADLVTVGFMRKQHWLLWTVVAAEVGYSYDGEEFWQSFAGQVPSWRRFENRDTIRTWFKRFAKTYSGFVPQGRWARHFGIIAWPISHSILPRDLQIHFARLLYDMRFDLARQVNLGVEKVEELLAARDATGSSRFNDLLEQTQLLARVVLALRDEDVQGAVHPIYPPTLARLVSDIGAKRAAREWLKEARRILRNARFDATALAGRHAVPAQESGAAAKVTSLRLVAKRSGDGSCQIAVALPDLTLILAACGIADETLKKSRVRLFDAEAFWPGQAVRSLSNKERQISRLPEPFDAPVLDWKGLPEQYVAALAPYMRLVGQPPWLLRRQEDGLFRQSVTKRARSGQSYLVVAQSPVDPSIVYELAMEKCVAVPGTQIYAFDLPTPVSPKRQDALAKIGIGYSLRAKVSPLGLLPRWEPHGRSSVWLANEEVMLRLSADFAVNGYVVSIDGKRTHVSADTGDDVLISVGILPIGLHTIEVAARPVSTAVVKVIETETFFVDVRAPFPWRYAGGSRTGFAAVLDPPEASFEHLLKGKASINVIGPPDRTIVARACLYDANGHQSASHELGQLRLPSIPSAIERFIAKIGNEAFLEDILSAPRVDLVFQVEELGDSRIRIQQQVKPFRWKVETAEGRTSVRLIDESGEADVVVSRYGIQDPTRRLPLEHALSLNGFELQYPASLLSVKIPQKEFLTLISVPSSKKISSLPELGMGVNVFQDVPLTQPEKTGTLIRADRLWRKANILGPLAMHRKAAVLEAVERRIAQTMCGSNWANQMANQASAPTDRRTTERLQREVGGSQGFVARIRGTSWNLKAPGIEALKSTFAEIAGTYSVSANAELCGLAIALALDPRLVKSKDAATAKVLASSFAEIAANQALARGAFLAKYSSRLATADLPTEERA